MNGSMWDGFFVGLTGFGALLLIILASYGIGQSDVRKTIVEQCSGIHHMEVNDDWYSCEKLKQDKQD